MDEALEYVEATLQVLNLSPRPYPRIVANQYGTWGNVAMSLNKPKLAREKCEKAHQINQEIYATEKVITSQYVASYSELGRIMIMNNEIEEAEKLIKKSEDLRRQMPHFSRLQLYSPFIFKSYILIMKGKYTEAEDILKEAIKDRELVYGKDDTENKR